MGPGHSLGAAPLSQGSAGGQGLGDMGVCELVPQGGPDCRQSRSSPLMGRGLCPLGVCSLSRDSDQHPWVLSLSRS